MRVVELSCSIKFGSKFCALPRATMATRTQEANLFRKNNRSQFVSNVSRNSNKPFDDDTWHMEITEKLLDAHYKCDRPGPKQALDDALWMIKTSYPKITVGRSRKQLHADKGDGTENAPEQKWKLWPSVVPLIESWYGRKDAELQEGANSDVYKEEREARHERVERQVQEEQLSAEESEIKKNTDSGTLLGKGQGLQANVAKQEGGVRRNQRFDSERVASLHRCEGAFELGPRI